VLRSPRSTDLRKTTTNAREEEEQSKAGVLHDPVDLLIRHVLAALELRTPKA
jgi:hypothetical protein